VMDWVTDVLASVGVWGAVGWMLVTVVVCTALYVAGGYVIVGVRWLLQTLAYSWRVRRMRWEYRFRRAFRGP